MTHQKYDVAIVGGGAAGLSAALVLARSRRRVVVLDGGNPRNAPAAHMHNFLSRDGMPPAELLALGRAEVLGYGSEIVSASTSLPSVMLRTPTVRGSRARSITCSYPAAEACAAGAVVVAVEMANTAPGRRAIL